MTLKEMEKRLKAMEEIEARFFLTFVKNSKAKNGLGP
jgi:hypothetical protein